MACFCNSSCYAKSIGSILFTRVRGSRILRSSSNQSSRKFGLPLYGVLRSSAVRLRAVGTSRSARRVAIRKPRPKTWPCTVKRHLTNVYQKVGWGLQDRGGEDGPPGAVDRAHRDHRSRPLPGWPGTGRAHGRLSAPTPAKPRAKRSLPIVISPIRPLPKSSGKGSSATRPDGLRWQ
jgi:hypothetical protein